MPKKIISHPDICNGTPVLENTRITVKTILEFMAVGEPMESILEEYPALSHSDLLACIDYASKAMGNHYELSAIS
jgi:uncharacterized protein (DUF433 family)